MNQQIQFNDQLQVDMQQHHLSFTALVAGQKVGCYIALPALAHLANAEITTQEQAIQAFEQHRFDLEDEAETLIEEENFDAQGRIWLQHPAI
ncbi:DUF1488 domain-containing protein [Ferrimonas sp. YFM]|uniref:DUF1488 domain-containing protein n=1 Tax=Ferrimonas sp. YFM TaxID=3028878 RepID=UPI00257473BE|nr:DUF1488 domain-containing protein [Ferrimonas sp. YFM]BDY02993.1 hypothetical protein F0521_00340 [Ferrimonas sp. YFM]